VDKSLRVFMRFVLVGVLVALLVLVVPTCLGAYSVGVRAGDWVKYRGTASGLGSGEFLGLSGMDWMKGEVLSVSGTTVTVQMTAHYKNVSEQVQRLVGDMASSSGNLTFMIMLAGLEKGDAFPLAMFGSGEVGLVINDTVSRTYLGASRGVNVLSISVSEDYASVEAHAYWDQVTGVLMELSMQVSAMGQTMQMSIEAIETNMWSAGLLGGSVSGLLADSFICIVGIAAVTVIVVSAVLLMRRRKPVPAAVPAVPSASVPSEEKTV